MDRACAIICINPLLNPLAGSRWPVQNGGGKSRRSKMKETSSIVVLINIDHNFKLYLRPNYLLGMDVIATLWIVANLCCFLVTTIYAFRDYELCPSFLHDLFEWGKTRNKKEYSWWRSWFHVPNRLMEIFYFEYFSI